MSGIRWLTSLSLATIITAFFTFIFYQTGIKEWWVMGIISFIISTLLIRVVMYCIDEV